MTNIGKLGVGALVLVALAAGAALSVGLFTAKPGIHSGNCAEDNEIASSERDGVDNAAMAFVRTAMGSHPENAYATMTNEAKTSVSREKFITFLKQMVRTSGPFRNTRLLHTYFIQNGGNGPDARAICGKVAGDDWVSVQVKPSLPQAHVVIASSTVNNDWAITLWLLPDGDSWQVQYFNMSMSSIVGLTPDMLLARARREREAGRAFNAAMLYAGVQGTIDRGPAFRLGAGQALRADLENFAAPPELSGDPPFDWNMNGVDYNVGQVTIIGIAGKLGLVFMLPQAVWSSDPDADAGNRAFINAFIATHPDYSNAFAFLVARALKPDNSGGFATVYENGKGFD
ncbi:MAG: hypothetical protein ABSC92_08430 [Rhizomicrobium sp.]|jgi:hypothetical protein